VKLEVVARACWEANRGIALAVSNEALNPWDTASAWQRHQTFEAVRRCRDAWVAGVVMDAGVIHAWWMDQLSRAGWSFGPVTDRAAKVRSDMRDFASLSVDERRALSVVCAICRVLLPEVASAEPRSIAV